MKHQLKIILFIFISIEDLELQTLQTLKLFGSIKKLIDETEKGGNLPLPEVFEIVLVQCNLVDNQNQQVLGIMFFHTQ